MVSKHKPTIVATVLIIALLPFELTINTTFADSGGWEELSTTTLDGKCPLVGGDMCGDNEENLDMCEANPINGNPKYNFPLLCRNVTEAWSGAAFDTTRNQLYIWGGGHMNYLGNELYALNLNSVPTMTRLTNPAPLDYETELQESPLPPLIEPSELPPFDGTQPKSRETYDGLVYLPVPDKLWAWSGSLAIFGFPDGVTWLFDPALNSWERQFPTGSLPLASIAAVSAYDPNTGSIYLHNMQNLYRYTYNTSGGNYEMLTMYEPGFYIHMNGVIDPKRKKFILIGPGEEIPGEEKQGQIIIYDIDPDITDNEFMYEEINTVGDTAFLGAEAPGLAYDPVIEKVVAWAGGDTVYLLDLDTNPPTWTAESYPIQPPLASEAPQAHNQGTYGRFEYAPAAKAFVLYNATNKNGYLFRWPDTDDDGVIDKIDNCIEIANLDQRDTDNDGYGNLCDGDFDNNNITNFADFSYFRQQFNTTDDDSDLDGNGIVNFADFAIFRSLFNQPPGPAASN